MQPARLVHTAALSALVAVATGVAPSAARAEVVGVDRACYLDTVRADERVAPRVRLAGRGFTPGALFQVSLDGLPLSGGLGTVDAAGEVAGSFATPSLRRMGRAERSWLVRVDEGPHTASARFSTSDVVARFSPTRGNPRTMRVRWRAHGLGFAPDGEPLREGRSVYLHYIRPNGRLRRTVRLGRTSGPCGRLARTSRRRLFPFRPERGRWRLQVDTRKRYTRGRATSSFVHDVVAVRVR